MNDSDSEPARKRFHRRTACERDPAAGRNRTQPVGKSVSVPIPISAPAANPELSYVGYTPRVAKRAKVQAGTAAVNASDIKELRKAWRNRQLVLFLGAGVSIPYGLPSWKNLVLELLFEHAQGTRRLGHLWPHYRRAVASWMTDYFDYDPLVLARMVERDLRAAKPASPGEPSAGVDLFLERLRAHLYAGLREPGGRTKAHGKGVKKHLENHQNSHKKQLFPLPNPGISRPTTPEP